MIDPFLKNDSADDLFNMLTGKEIGRGQYRIVYDCAINPKWVVKQDSGDNRSNLYEWDVWNHFKGTSLEKWLCPILHCSPRGLWIIAPRTTPITRKQMPRRVPDLLNTDVKLDNWGMLRGKPVCHDYGNNRLYRLADAPGRKLVRVDPSCLTVPFM